MFGHNDSNQKQDDGIATSHDDIAAAAEAIANDRAGNNADTNSGGGTLGSFMPTASTAAPAVVAPTTAPTQSAGHTDESSRAPAALGAASDSTHAAASDTDGLLDIKHEALQALTPLVSQLNQTPEEQFRTTMMMIQASDNYSLLKVAYEAAQKISNEKERAQALLDIVNEINYFTQQA